MEPEGGILIILIAAIWLFMKIRRKYSGNYSLKEEIKDKIERKFRSRKGYYRNVYLKSDAWKRKRYVVLKRDNWQCVYCGRRATQVHHKKYAKRKIGKEPIDWLESVCYSCHKKKHRWKFN